MKGIIIYENDLRAINAVKLKNASFCYESVEDDITDTLKGRPVTCESANCNKEDTYNFEVGALIALMKMCGVDKVKKAAKETFFDVAENTVNEYEEEIKTLKEKFDKKVSDLRDQIHENSRLIQTNGELMDKNNELEEENKNLKKEKEQIIVARSILNNKLIEENSNLKYIKSCNESAIESLKNTRDLLINKNNEVIEENKNLKKRINELENYTPCQNKQSQSILLGGCKMNDIYIEKDDKEILKQEYCEAADKIRKTMVLMSFYKYGPAKKNFKEGRVDAFKSAEECMQAFKKDKNTEHLLDAMNYLMFRYMYPLPGEHYKATDSDGSVKPVGTPIKMEDPYDTWVW